MTQQMSITRALVELKTSQDKINRAIEQGVFVSKVVGSDNYRKVLGSPVSVEAMEATIKGSYDSVESLVSRRQAIKSAIVLSNARANVEVMGKTMTVAEAIELKSTLDFRKFFLNSLKVQYTQAKNQVEANNAQLEKTIEQLLTTSYGSDKTKIDADTVKAISEPQRKQKEAALLDPSKIEDKIKKAQDEVDVLTSEIDFVLSESNAKTLITV